MQPPQTLDELGEGLMLLEHLNSELPTIEAKIAPLFEQFAILDKYEVTVAEDIRTGLLELPNKYREFEQTLLEADTMLKKNKVQWLHIDWLVCYSSLRPYKSSEE